MSKDNNILVNAFICDLIKTTLDYAEEICPKRINDMDVLWECSDSVDLGQPIIRIAVRSSSPTDNKVFGCKQMIPIQILHPGKGVPDISMPIFRYYSDRLRNTVHKLFVSYCRQVCEYEKRRKTNDET